MELDFLGLVGFNSGFNRGVPPDKQHQYNGKYAAAIFWHLTTNTTAHFSDMCGIRIGFAHSRTQPLPLTLRTFTNFQKI